MHRTTLTAIVITLGLIGTSGRPASSAHDQAKEQVMMRYSEHATTWLSASGSRLPVPYTLPAMGS